jgi:hypothetical protein
MNLPTALSVLWLYGNHGNLDEPWRTPAEEAVKPAVPSTG